jgi:hypothetical protein
MARKGKFNPEVVRRICEAIADTGLDSAGYAAGGISRNTFYGWLKRGEDETGFSGFSGFSDRVLAAREQYRLNSAPQHQRWARQALTQQLQELVEGRELVTTVTKDAIAPDGSIVSLASVTRAPNRIPVQWMLNYVLPERTDIIAWLTQGAELGVIPLEVIEDAIAGIDGLKDQIRKSFERGGEGTRSGEGEGSPGARAGLAIRQALGLLGPDLDALSTPVDAGPEPEENLGEI